MSLPDTEKLRLIENARRPLESEQYVAQLNLAVTGKDDKDAVQALKDQLDAVSAKLAALDAEQAKVESDGTPASKS